MSAGAVRVRKRADGDRRRVLAVVSTRRAPDDDQLGVRTHELPTAGSPGEGRPGEKVPQHVADVRQIVHDQDPRWTAHASSSLLTMSRSA
jgi:hypothetical protein